MTNPGEKLKASLEAAALVATASRAAAETARAKVADVSRETSSEGEGGIDESRQAGS